MAQAFRRRRGRVVGRLDEDERDLVATMITQVAELIRGMGPEMPRQTGDPLQDMLSGLDAAPQPQGDPALRRLFPDARRDEGDEARREGEEFRRLTEMGLRQRKVETLEAAAELLTRDRDPEVVTLTPQEAGRLTVALTDVRLVLGERLGLRTDEDTDTLEALVEAFGEEHPMVQTAAIYDFLTWLQETLAESLIH